MSRFFVWAAIMCGIVLGNCYASSPSFAAEAARSGSTDSRKPNVVFILADDIGYGDIGCYGAKVVKTPHCDRLAREGVRFTDAHATGSTCTPTRYAFITGQYAWRRPGRRRHPQRRGAIGDGPRQADHNLRPQASRLPYRPRR